jgi:Bifunctional DNA primase/polymerase, N-terminal
MTERRMPRGPNVLGAALAYAARGWPVLPCEPACKVPIGRLAPHGLHSATTDPARVRAWWRAEPRANVAIVMGPAAGLFAVDVDPRHGGDRTLADLEASRGALPFTLRARTGGGGAHVFFRLPSLAVLRSGANVLGPGVDIKARGGYVVACPSSHQSGGRYMWEKFTDPAEPPAWLLRLAAPLPVVPLSRLMGADRRPDTRDRASRYLAAMPAAVSGQGGHLATFRAAIVLVRGFALDPTIALDLLAREYNPRCRPPWRLHDLAHKVASATWARVQTGYLIGPDRDPR